MYYQIYQASLGQYCLQKLSRGQSRIYWHHQKTKLNKAPFIRSISPPLEDAAHSSCFEKDLMLWVVFQYHLLFPNFYQFTPPVNWDHSSPGSWLPSSLQRKDSRFHKLRNSSCKVAGTTLQPLMSVSSQISNNSLSNLPLPLQEGCESDWKCRAWASLFLMYHGSYC